MIKQKEKFKNPNITPRIREYTFNLFKYYPEMLPKESDDLICRICVECGKIEHIQYKSYNKQKYPNLCRSCSRKKTMMN